MVPLISSTFRSSQPAAVVGFIFISEFTNDDGIVVAVLNPDEAYVD